MNPTEIRDKLIKGEITSEQAQKMWQERRQKMELAPVQQQGLTTKVESLPDMRQINDRTSLARVRADLAQEIIKRDAIHFAQREYVGETARHFIALPAYAVIGIADGALDSVGYGVAEFAEDISFMVSRTIRRLKEGWFRGTNG